MDRRSPPRGDRSTGATPMTESPDRHSKQEHDGSRSETEPSHEPLDDGRYLYCVVSLDGGEEPGSDGSTIDARGIDDREPYVVSNGDVGAVIQECARTYDPDDLTRLRQLLLTHQSVVDAATEGFGTPLPTRFGTLLDGGDAAVVDWLADERERLRHHLERFDGTSEYRIRVAWTEPPEPGDRNEELASLRDRTDAADDGKGFLLEKQYEQRLAAWRSERKADLGTELRERLEPLVVELERLDEQSSPIAVPDDDTTLVSRVAIRATEDDEAPIGDELEAIAERSGVEVRFTGPWPPYTFTPDL